MRTARVSLLALITSVCDGRESHPLAAVCDIAKYNNNAANFAVSCAEKGTVIVAGNVRFVFADERFVVGQTNDAAAMIKEAQPKRQSVLVLRLVSASLVSVSTFYL